MPRFIPRDYQETQAAKGYAILAKYGLAYDTSQERVGKSLVKLMIFERSSRKKLLVLTKKAAISDWKHLVEHYPIPGKEVEVINYESVHKIIMKPDMAVLDEAHHALSKYPKPSKTFLKVAAVVYGLPLLYDSATPHAETSAQLYHQLRLSMWSPFAEYKSFYKFHEEYGLPYVTYLGSRQIKMYDRMQEGRVMALFEPLTYGLTRKDVGFEHEPTNKVHRVQLEEGTEKSYTTFSKNLVMEIEGFDMVAETAGALLQKLAQMVGGTMKVEIGMKSPTQKDYKTFWLGNTEKIDYIKKTWGDTEDLVIMYQYKEEEHLLNHHFKKAKVLQGDRFAEGITLKHVEHLAVYSMSWRTSKYIQRRARQADLERDTPIIVHYILTEDKVDNMIYEAVVEKGVNFNGRYFKENKNAG